MADRARGSQAVLTAQDLRAGHVVYWDGDGWSPRLEDALIAHDGEARATLTVLAAEANAGTTVIDAFLAEVTDGPSGRHPVRYREAQREAGPSIAYGPAPVERGLA